MDASSVQGRGAVWRQRLETLRDQFASASSTCPHLRHALLAAVQEDSKVLHEAIDRERRRKSFACSHGEYLRRQSWQILDVRHAFTTDPAFISFSRNEYQRFSTLASAAGRLILDLPPYVLSLLAAPNDEPNSDAGVFDELWLAAQITEVKRAFQLEGQKQVEAAGGNAADVYVPDRDHLAWRCDSKAHESHWCILLHNLAWKAGESDTLHAERSTWDGTAKFILGPPDLWRRLLTGSFSGEGDPVVPLPLRWMRSDLSADPFLCSVWAIDMLLDAEGNAGCYDREMDELESTVPPLDRDNGLWVRNTLAAKLDGKEVPTLTSYRSQGRRNLTASFGTDRDGRIWRRGGTPTSHPWYLKSSLVSQRESS